MLDKQTRKPKGTAFVEFEAPAAAQKAAAACAKARCAPLASHMKAGTSCHLVNVCCVPCSVTVHDMAALIT